MSDKSFGDHTNRGVVKNPLLSNVVTGLSLDELTQNAVLLPVSTTLGMIADSEHTSSTSHTLAHVQDDRPISTSGDADKNIPHLQPSNDDSSNKTGAKKKIVKQHETGATRLPKDSVKSDDDFDVNEYFARLQGTRYVSAPIHSHIKDDRGANVEENLEEINLNEPDKPLVDVQQSLTADIAQNFSQLPTVLPHVASAVFSSFSNMLSLKGREQTSDNPKPIGGYREMEMRKPGSTTVPLMSVEEPVRNIGPPPKEPPIGGSGNFRITTKKKYAQIPGLTCGDTGHNIYGAALNPNIPPSFTPAHIERDKTSKSEVDKQNLTILNDASNITATETGFNNSNRNQNALKHTGHFNPVAKNAQFGLNDLNGERKVDTYNIFNPAEDYIQNTPKISDSQAATEMQPKFFDVTNKKETNPDGKVTNTIFMQDINASLDSASVVPPPPMFSNIHKNKPSVGKSILPPSVARRISANQPIIKPPSVTSTVVENIFIPTLVDDTVDQSARAITFQDGSALTQSSDPVYLSSTNNLPQPPSQFATATVPASSSFYTPAPDIHTPFAQKRASSASKCKPIEPTIFIPVLPGQSNFGTISPISSFISTSVPSMLTSNITYSNTFNNELASSISDTSNIPNTSMLPPLDIIQPTFGVPLSTPSIGSNTYPPVVSQPQPSASVLFHPSQIQNERKETQDVDQAQCAIKYFDPSTMSSEPSLPITEPPKASNSLNYRMTKKKPQYYSGPIDGVGYITNNVKPMISPGEADYFSGALFTPIQHPVERDNSEHSPALFDNSNSTNAASVPFDINKTVLLPPEHNTGFDLSRQTTEMEIPKEDSKGFGIIGSLKSKLSAIDINKIHNSVTNFFDPGYNNVKTNTTHQQENVPYQQNTYEQNSQNSRTIFEEFVPNVEHSSESQDGQMYHHVPHNYNNTNTPQDPYIYPNHSITVQPTPTNILDSTNSESPFSYTDNRIDDVTMPNDNFTITKIISIPSVGRYGLQTENISNKQKSHDELASVPQMHKDNDPTCENDLPAFTQDVIEGSNDLSSRSFFDTPLLDNQTFDGPVGSQSNSSNLITIDDSCRAESIDNTKTNVLKSQFESFPVPTLDIAKQDKLLKKVFDTEEKKTQVISERKLNCIPFYKNVSTNTAVEDTLIHIKPKNQQLVPEIQIRETNLLESLSTDEIPIVAVSSVPLFGLSTIIAEIPKETVTSDTKKSEGSVSKVQRPYDEKAVAKFFENIPPREITPAQENKAPGQTEKSRWFKFLRLPETEKESDLNICETCREVNKHDERETDDLTRQLIDNITAPIQLSNPVEALFTDGETTQSRVEFDRDEFDKISHIPDDTTGSIHRRSANKLLNNASTAKSGGRSNYGWHFDSSSSDDDDDGFKFRRNTRYGTSYKNKLPFFERVLNNETVEFNLENNIDDEDSQENAAAVAVSPIASPTDENNLRSEAAGPIDVNSIELDASRYYPLFVIEPEYSNENENVVDPEDFQDTGMNMESFTNRIERFQKRGDSYVVNPENSGTTSSNLINPSVHIPSYFDTGNYAADAHFRNSLYSPSAGNYMGSPSQPLRIPPGFEDEYQRRMSGVTSHIISYFDSDSKSDEPFIPETSTQTSTTMATTYAASNQFDVQSHLTNFADEDDSSPPPRNKRHILTMMFGAQSDDEDAASDFIETMATRGSDDMTPTDPPDIYDELEVDPVENPRDVENFSRLASYFGSPTNIEHPRSYFELSQSENHYRNNLNENQIRQDHIDSEIRDTNNEHYVANLNLMRALTSVDNIQIPKDQTDKIVQYFTFEYDRDVKTLVDEIKIKNKLFKKIHELNFDTMKENERHEDIDKKLTDTFLFKTVSDCETEFDKNDILDDKLNPNTPDDSDNEKFYKNVYNCDTCSNYFNINNADYNIRRVMNDSVTGGNKKIGNIMTQANEDARRSVTVDFDSFPLQDDTDDGVTVLNENRTAGEYAPVKHHWFYRVDIDDKSIWRGFSVVDSTALEAAYLSQNLTEETVVPTDGGRYDVNLVGRLRRPVYWSDKPTNVRRCSWFYKGTTDARYVPYTENVAEKLEDEYRHGMMTGEWHRQLILPNSELVVMHGPSVMVHFLHGGAVDTFSTTPLFTFGKRVYRNPPKIRVARDQPENIDHLILLVHGAGEYRHQKEKIQSTSRPRVVRRGHDESEIEDTEPSSIDHLLLLCHGVGSACDMRFRNVEEVVDDFRATSLQLVQSHYRNSYENGAVSRVEVLPISWHSTLHSGENGVDRRLAQITLDSIPRLRNFTNDTVLDVLFYTSPVYCQTITDTVCNELNRIYSLFLQRNPRFTGGVSLGGHSLGSVILYDLLCHQESEPKGGSSEKVFVARSNGGCTGQPNVIYPKLVFNPAALYALGSPIAIFECIRGVESLGMNFALPTCNNFFNIFHPYDPIAYRIEPLINPQLRNVKPFLVPHHKGRKRMHLELKDTMVRVGADLKQKFIESIRTTWNKWKTQTPTDAQLEKVVEEEIETEQLKEEMKDEQTHNETATPEMLGKLNAGRRVDYVLQEAPLEVINEYLFAMSSHVGYWESEDTMLLMLREIYDVLGVQPDSTIPQQNMTVQRTRALKQDDTVVIDQPTTSRDIP